MFDTNITEIAGHKVTLHAPIMKVLTQYLIGYFLDDYELVTVSYADWVIQIGEFKQELVIHHNSYAPHKPTIDPRFKVEYASGLSGLFNALVLLTDNDRVDVLKDEDKLNNEAERFPTRFHTQTGIKLSLDDVAKVYQLMSDASRHVHDKMIVREFDKLVYVCEDSSKEGLITKEYAELTDFEIVWHATPLSEYEREGELCIPEEMSRLKHASLLSTSGGDTLTLEDVVKAMTELDAMDALLAVKDADAKEVLEDALRALNVATADAEANGYVITSAMPVLVNVKTANDAHKAILNQRIAINEQSYELSVQHGERVKAQILARGDTMKA